MHPTAISPANKHAIAKRPQADANTIRISLNKQLPVFPIIFKAINCKLTHIRYVFNIPIWNITATKILKHCLKPNKKGDAFASPFSILVQIALLLHFPDVVSLEKLLE